MGRYIPPDALDAGLTNANVASGKGHALGSRARKINQGILTVRFEMPFAVWCTSCPQPTIIAQGVRFNAEKKKVGNYHSTPILSFRIKHNACGGWLEIRTDPKNAEYVVHEGGKRRDYGEEKEDGKHGPLGEILTEEERERRRNDAFAAFEGKVEEKQKGQAEGWRVEELLESRERDWRDPYAANRRMRKTFRVERKARHRNEQEKEAIRERLGLGIELLDVTEADHRAAKLVDFVGHHGQHNPETLNQRLSAQPLFSSDTPLSKSLASGANVAQRTASSPKVANPKLRLQESLTGNTRAVLNPFGQDRPHIVSHDTKSSEDQRLVRRGINTTPKINAPQASLTSNGSLPSDLSRPLVDYDSD